MNIYTALDTARENELIETEAERIEYWRGRRQAFQDIIVGKVTITEKEVNS